MSGTTRAWQWHHTGISVVEIDYVVDYYRKTFGFEVIFEARDMKDLISSITGVPGLGAHLVQMKSGISEQVIEFIEFFNLPETYSELLPLTPGRSHTAYLVNDIEESMRELESAGGIILGQITEFSESKAIYCADKFGTVIELEQLVR